MLPALRELLPAGGLQRGSVVAAEGWGLLCLALAAGASAAGAWCAVAGLPELGVRAAAEAGLDTSRLLLVAEPGRNWPQVAAWLLEGCELVLVRPPARPSAQVRRRLEALTRRSGGVLVVAGGWDGAQVRLLVARQQWAGIGSGHGRLRARSAQVAAEGRGAAARPRARWLWLPGPDGSIAALFGPDGLAGAPPWPDGLAGAPLGPDGLAGAPLGPDGLAGLAGAPPEPGAWAADAGGSLGYRVQEAGRLRSPASGLAPDDARLAGAAAGARRVVPGLASR